MQLRQSTSTVISWIGRAERCCACEGRLKEEDATELAYIDEEVKEQELYHQAVFEVTECLIRNG